MHQVHCISISRFRKSEHLREHMARFHEHSRCTLTHYIEAKSLRGKIFTQEKFADREVGGGSVQGIYVMFCYSRLLLTLC